jgi:hypothetical protein
MAIDPNHIPRAPETRRKKTKWESLNEIDARFGRRSAELRAARAAHEAMAAPRAPELEVVTGTTAPESPPLSAWWGVALATLAAVCALAFAIVAQ